MGEWVHDLEVWVVCRRLGSSTRRRLRDRLQLRRQHPVSRNQSKETRGYMVPVVSGTRTPVTRGFSDHEASRRWTTLCYRVLRNDPR